MARITVEDCLDHVDNRFELVLVGSKRARQLMVGNKEPQVAWENDKATVVALREIEQGLVTADILEESTQEDYFEDDFATSFDRQNAEIAALMTESTGESSVILDATPVSDSAIAASDIQTEE